MPAKLSTHVLDLAAGFPAAGMKLRLLFLDGEASLLKELTTNRDGRTDEPLLTADAMRAGEYRLQFFVQDYFVGRQVECAFLTIVSVDFHLTDATASYHVPLLVTPWSYSTYRGS